VKLPMPQPEQLPLITRFWSEVVAPVIVTVPGKVAVMPFLPIVMPVAADAPMEIVPVASMTLFESPVMLVPLNVSAAVAMPPPHENFLYIHCEILFFPTDFVIAFIIAGNGGQQGGVGISPDRML